MAILQGVTELFPVSSLGHAVILPRLLHWGIDQKAADFLPYLVVMHLGTAIALLAAISGATGCAFATSLLSQSSPRAQADRRIFLFVVLATIPAVIVGDRSCANCSATPSARRCIAAIFLVVNGFILFRRRQDRRTRRSASSTSSIGRARWRSASPSAPALIPGISRSGATIVTGVVAGLQHKDSARFSFLMAPPIMLGATVHEAPALFREGATLGGAAHSFGNRRRRRRLCSASSF